MRLKTYQHFGMRQRWLDEFLAQPDSWWRTNSLGPRQFDAMKTWLADAELLPPIRSQSLAERCSAFRNPAGLTWAVIWCNLVRNSSLLQWYAKQIPWRRTYSRAELIDMLPEHLAQEHARERHQGPGWTPP